MLRNVFTPPCGFDLATTTVATTESLAAIAFWGYRLVAHPNGTCFVHETYYDKREGILGIAREPARPCGDSVDDVDEELGRMMEGLQEQTLRFLDFVSTPAHSGGDGADTPPPSPEGSP